MAAYRNLWLELCSLQNLEFAFKKARKGKTTKDYVVEFEKKLKENLQQLRIELLLHSYRPKPLQTFILRDPKTRKISKSHFRDRVIHHALCNIIEPLFEKQFIYDSYANRKAKGTLRAIQRFDCFKVIVSQNNTKSTFVFKADIKKYFEEPDLEFWRAREFFLNVGRVFTLGFAALFFFMGFYLPVFLLFGIIALAYPFIVNYKLTDIE